MTVLDIIKGWLGAEPNLEDFIVTAGDHFPEIKPQADAMLAKLRVGVDNSSLISLAAAVGPEGLNILRGHLEPKDHPSDLI